MKTRKSSCVKTQEAYRPRHILSVAFPALGGGGVVAGVPCPGLGGGIPCPGPGWGVGWGGVSCPGPDLGTGGYPVLVLSGGEGRAGVSCPGPGWGPLHPTHPQGKDQ